MEGRNRVLKIALTDNDISYSELMLNILSNRFDIKTVTENPDIVIHGAYPGYEFLKYPYATRFFLSQEAIIPDFNLTDYGFGFAHLNFDDRYLRIPNFALHEDYIRLASGQGYFGDSKFAARSFCNFIYSHDNGHPARRKIFEAISSISKVDAPGELLNNTKRIGKSRADKISCIRNYRFTIACENSQSPGYVTEKLSDALAANTIPIYWGDPQVERTINPERLVVVRDLERLDLVVSEVKRLNENEEEYSAMTKKRLLTKDQVSVAPSIDQILDFFENAIGKGRQRSSHMWGRLYEERALRMARNDARVRRVTVPINRALGTLLPRALFRR